MRAAEPYLTEYQAKIQGRRATVFSVFSALSLIVCAAFGPNIANTLGVPAPVTYTLAGLGGLLTLVLNLGADLRGFSRRFYLLAARGYAAVLVALNLIAAVFVVADYRSLNSQSAATLAILLLFCFGALFFLRRLSTILGSTPPEAE